MSRILRVLMALLLATSVPLTPVQAQSNGGKSIRVMTLYDLPAVSVTYCAMETKEIPGPSFISAAASNTITGTGTPFLEVAVGDELQISQAAATPTTYLVGVEARASSSSITGAYRNPDTLASSTMTFTNAAFTVRKLRCGTGNNAGIIPVNFGPWSISITTYRINVGASIDWNVMCRTNPAAQWSQVSPALAIPAVGPTYNSITAISSYTITNQDPWAECRVGMLIVGGDTGIQAVSVVMSTRLN